jgi:Domain of unknown function (DUF6429)
VPTDASRIIRQSVMKDVQAVMEIDPDRIDEAVLALLFLGRHEKVRTWKSFDWAAMERLHAKGLISDPVGKAKSVVFRSPGSILGLEAGLHSASFDKVDRRVEDHLVRPA